MYSAPSWNTPRTALCAYAVEEFSARTQIQNEVEVVCGLEVVDEGKDVWVAHRDLLEYSYLVSDHILTACHQALANDFAGVVFAGLDMDL